MTEDRMKICRPRSLEEATDEVQREFNVRERCFPRWIAEGRVSKTDAQDRLDRLASALEYLGQLPANVKLPSVKT